MEEIDLESLKTLVEQKRAKLEILQRHRVEKASLEALIVKWREAGQEGLSQLIEKTKDSKTAEEILDALKIPHEMFL